MVKSRVLFCSIVSLSWTSGVTAGDDWGELGVKLSRTREPSSLVGDWISILGVN